MRAGASGIPATILYFPRSSKQNCRILPPKKSDGKGAKKMRFATPPAKKMKQIPSARL